MDSGEPGFTRVGCNLDLAAEGKQIGHLSVPHSRDESAWGALLVPIACIRNGDGPTVLLTGANHGDEYEGPIALSKLVRRLRPEAVRGRLIVLPALNLPALKAGRRTSPIDGLNMNRIFPGRWDGSVSEMIADYVYRFLIREADAVIDLHSGGKTLNFVPSVLIHTFDDPARMAAHLDAAKAFAAPHTLVLRELDDQGMIDTAVERLGKLFISTELGGGGSVTTETVAIAERGLDRLLHHLGALAGGAAEAPPATRLLTTPDPRCFVSATADGVYEVLADLGREVRSGDPLGQIHDPDDPAAAPVVAVAPRNGVIACRHHPGLIQRGDCLAVIACDRVQE